MRRSVAMPLGILNTCTHIHRTHHSFNSWVVLQTCAKLDMMQRIETHVAPWRWLGKQFRDPIQFRSSECNTISLRAFAFFLCMFLLSLCPCTFRSSMLSQQQQQQQRGCLNENGESAAIATWTEENGENAKWNERWLAGRKRLFDGKSTTQATRCVCDFTAATFCNRPQMDSGAIWKCAWCMPFFGIQLPVQRLCSWWHGSNGWYVFFLYKKLCIDGTRHRSPNGFCVWHIEQICTRAKTTLITYLSMIHVDYFMVIKNSVEMDQYSILDYYGQSFRILLTVEWWQLSKLIQYGSRINNIDAFA